MTRMHIAPQYVNTFLTISLYLTKLIDTYCTALPYSHQSYTAKSAKKVLTVYVKDCTIVTLPH